MASNEIADVSPELIEVVRAEARRRRALTAVERRRSALSSIVDTGDLTDADVQLLYDEYVNARRNADARP